MKSPFFSYFIQWGHRVLVPTLAALALSLPAAAAQTNQLHDFEASGPVRVALDQVVAVCATNYGAAAHSMLLAVVDATPGANSAGILATQQFQVPPYQSVCLNLPGVLLQALGPQASVVGLAVDGGFVDQGVIRQGGGISGGGCIASVQVFDTQTGKTAVLAQTIHRQIR